MQLDGVNDYLEITGGHWLPTSGEVSFSTWIKPEAVNGIRNIVAHGYATNPKGEVFLRINNGQYQVGSWNGANHIATAAIPSADIGQWVHLAGVYDGSAWRLYRNGTEVAATIDATGPVRRAR